MQYNWVKKTFPKAYWDKWCAENAGYTMITAGKDSGVTAAFIVPGDKIPRGCERLTDNELQFVDAYRRGQKMLPYPLHKADDDKQ